MAFILEFIIQGIIEGFLFNGQKKGVVGFIRRAILTLLFSTIALYPPYLYFTSLAHMSTTNATFWGAVLLIIYGVVYTIYYNFKEAKKLEKENNDDE